MRNVVVSKKNALMMLQVTFQFVDQTVMSTGEISACWSSSVGVFD
jgi:hypothetical protein